MKNNNFIIKLFTIFVIPLLLILIGTGLSIYYYREVSVTTLQYDHTIAQMQFSSHPELYKGDLIYGEFIAHEDNLGAIAVPVTTFNRINNDIIVFQLKEKGSKDWYCFNKYFTDRFPDNEPYPFGFPVIKNSKGKIYEFEIYSVNGIPNNAIGFLKNRQYFFSRYTFDRHTVIQSKKSILQFALTKSENLFLNINYLAYLMVFLVPAVLYLVEILFRNTMERMVLMRTILPHIMIATMVVVYVIQPVLMQSDIVIFLALMTYIVAQRFRISSSHIFGIALVLLFLSPLWLLTHMEEVASRSAIITFFYTIVGLLLLYNESRAGQKT